MKEQAWDNQDIRKFFSGKLVLIYDYYQPQVVYKIIDIDFSKTPYSKMNENYTYSEYYEDKHQVVVDNVDQPLLKVE